jgi:hypothetical protein
MHGFKTVLAVLGAAAVLVLAGNTVSLATTGNAFILGKGNSANNVTALTRTTYGSALKLTTKSSVSAPLTVNGKGKVTNLNADTVDGIDSSKLGTRLYKWEYVGSLGTDKTFTLTGLPVGSYLIDWQAFAIPSEIADASVADCYIQSDPATGSNRYTAEAMATKTTYGTPLSASGFLVHNTGDKLQLVCRTSDGTSTWTSSADEPVRITAVPLQKVTSLATPTAARVRAKR